MESDAQVCLAPRATLVQDLASALQVPPPRIASYYIALYYIVYYIVLYYILPRFGAAGAPATHRIVSFYIVLHYIVYYIASRRRGRRPTIASPIPLLSLPLRVLPRSLFSLSPLPPSHPPPLWRQACRATHVCTTPALWGLLPPGLGPAHFPHLRFDPRRPARFDSGISHCQIAGDFITIGDSIKLYYSL